MKQHTHYPRVSSAGQLGRRGQLDRLFFRTVCLLLAAIVTATNSGLAADEFPAQLKRVLDGGAPRTVAELKAMQSHVQELAKKVVAATVAIRLGPAHGSGVIVSPDGYILTAAHVAGRPGKRATIIMPDGRIVRGESLGLHLKLDAGLIKISDEGTWPHLKMGDSSQLSLGQWCAGTGHPGGFEPGRTPVFRLGRVLDRGKDKLIRTDLQLIGGDSGGPLVDLRGQVIGVHSRIGSSLANNQHVPISAYLEHWDQLVSGEELGLGQPWIGVVSENGWKSAAVTKIKEGSPAAKAGIEIGDVITSFDGKKVGSMSELRQLVLTKKPGDEVRVTVTRGNKTLEMGVIVGQRGL